MLTVSAAFAQEEQAGAEVADFHGQWSQFASSVVAGEGSGESRYGGRLDGYAQIDGERAGIADGLKINVQAEFIYGKSVNRVGSRVLLPVNTAMNFPKNDDESFDLSINIVQKIGKVRLQAGKINLLDASSAIPIVAGGGKEGFQHIGLAAPPGLVAYPKIFGAIASVPAGRLVLNFGVWTPDDWTREYNPRGFFSDGVNGMFAALLPAKIGGKQGYHTLTLFAMQRSFRSADAFPDFRPPEGTGPLLPDDKQGLHVRYAVQQFLWQDPLDRKRGFGFFAFSGVSLGAPGIMDWSLNAGMAGSVPFKGRPQDRFGMGYFRTSLANRIVDGLRPTIPLGDEQGAEAFYTARVVGFLKLTGSAQIVDSALKRAPTAVVVNLRGVVDF